MQNGMATAFCEAMVQNWSVINSSKPLYFSRWKCELSMNYFCFANVMSKDLNGCVDEWQEEKLWPALGESKSGYWNQRPRRKHVKTRSR